MISGTAITLCLALAAAASAQDASLVARATDTDGGAVVGAPVVLLHIGSGARRTGVTGDDGTLLFADLVSGEYRLEIAAPGFGLHARTITLAAGERTVDARLQLAAVREEITVRGAAVAPTIGRVDAPLRDQPLTVNTLNREYLETHAINDVVTALQHVPNVNAYTNYGVYQYFTFRGFRENVQMVDGIRNEGNRVTTQLANVERVEVLKGPASVLYGTGALGGTVNIVLKKPGPDPAYDASLAVGRWDTYRGTFGAGGRLSDTVFYRFDTAGESATNYRQDPSRRLNVTPSLTWRASNSAQLNVRYFVDRNRVSGDSGIPLVPLEGGFVPSAERGIIGDPLTRAISGDDGASIPNVPPYSRYNTPQDFGRAADQNLRLGYSQVLGGNVVFRDTLGYRRFDDEYFVAEFLDVTPPSQVNRGFLYFFHHRRSLVNQAELSARFTTGIEHEVLAGWDYQHYPNRTDRRGGANFNTAPIDLFNPVETHVDVDLDAFPFTRLDYQTSRSSGLFLQDTLTLAPALRLVVGGRFDNFRRRTHRNPVEGGVESEGPVDEGDFQDFNHRVGLVYQTTPTLDLYLQNSTSFQPQYVVNVDGTPLDPEYGVQYEAGQRVRLNGERLQLSTAVFQIEKRNLTRSLGAGIYEQIGRLRARGFEAELKGYVTPDWLLDLGYGFTAASFLDYTTSRGAVLSGNTPRRSPRHTVTLSTSYLWPNGLSVVGTGRYISSQFLNDFESVAFHGYERFSLGASYTRGRVQYALNLTNVTNTAYWQSSLGSRQLYPGEPFNVMATVRVRTN